MINVNLQTLTGNKHWKEASYKARHKTNVFGRF